jgi:hypothetical protein
MGSDPVVGLVKDRTDFELHGFEIAEGLFDQPSFLIPRVTVLTESTKAESRDQVTAG